MTALTHPVIVSILNLSLRGDDISPVTPKKGIIAGFMSLKGVDLSSSVALSKPFQGELVPVKRRKALAYQHKERQILAINVCYLRDGPGSDRNVTLSDIQRHWKENLSDAEPVATPISFYLSIYTRIHAVYDLHE